MNPWACLALPSLLRGPLRGLQLRVEGEGLRRLELSLADLHTRFKKHTITATLQCSGNRRAELHRIRPIQGLFWDNGAIGTATFGGVLLRDVLKHAGLDEDETEAEHIQFEGLDAEPGGQAYGASIPLDKARGLPRMPSPVVLCLASLQSLADAPGRCRLCTVRGMCCWRLR